MSHLIRIGLAGLGLLAIVLCAAGFVVRWPIADGALRIRAIRTIEASSGMTVSAAGPMSLVLLPRPTVSLPTLSMQAAEGAVAIDASAATGTLSLLGLIAGHFRLVKTALVSPTIALDLDRLIPILSGLAAVAQEARPRLIDHLHTNGLVVRSGVIRLKSKDEGRDTTLTDVNAVFEWPGDNSGASLNGTGTWRGQAVTAGLMLDAPTEWLSGRSSAVFVHLKSSLLDLTASGTMFGTGPTDATGWLTASTPNVPQFLRLIATPLPHLDHIQQARISGNVTVADRELSITGVELGLDAMLFEGALAVHAGNGHPGIVGTLATDSIDLGPFLQALPTPASATGLWSTVALDTESVASDDIDLRISAARARLGPIAFEDGGLSLQSRDGRMEISLGEARVYDGLFKGRLVAQADGDTTEIHADATLSQIDLKELAEDLDPTLHISGTSSGHVTIEGKGTTPRAIVRSLAGHGQLSVRNGVVQPDSVVPLVMSGETAPTVARPGTGATLPDIPFDSASVNFDINRGIVSIADGWLLRPDSRATVDGSLSLPLQTADMRMILSTVGGDLQAPAVPSMGFTLTGAWRNLHLSTGAVGLTERDRADPPAPAP